MTEVVAAVVEGPEVTVDIGNGGRYRVSVRHPLLAESCDDSAAANDEQPERLSGALSKSYAAAGPSWQLKGGSEVERSPTNQGPVPS